MNKRTSGLILAGVLATGAVGAVAITPAIATASGTTVATTSTNPVTSRIANIKSALKGLVTDGTLTQVQVDKVASTLGSKLPKPHLGGPGGPGRPGGPGEPGGIGHAQTDAAAAKALGLTTDMLHDALHGGKSLAQVAKDQKVSVDALVKAMVTAAQSELATAVKNGTLTQAQADKMKSSLTERITDRINHVRPAPGEGIRGAERPPTSATTSGSSSSTSSSTS